MFGLEAGNRERERLEIVGARRPILLGERAHALVQQIRLDRGIHAPEPDLDRARVQRQRATAARIARLPL